MESVGGSATSMSFSAGAVAAVEDDAVLKNDIASKSKFGPRALDERRSSGGQPRVVGASDYSNTNMRTWPTGLMVKASVSGFGC